MNKTNLPTILYVDDEIVNLELFEMAYHLIFNVITSESGFEGLILLEEDKEISFVISDMKMPKMNGLEFIKSLKEKKPDLPCILLSGYELTTEIQNAIDDKIIEGYFRKPYNNKELIKFIMRYIDNER